MGNIKDDLAKLKQNLRDMITTSSTQEDIAKITEMDKALDSINGEYEAQVEQNNQLKTDYINVIKHYGFSTPSATLDEDISGETEVDIEKILGSILEKRDSKKY